MEGTTGLSIPKAFFDLSQEHIFTAEAGLIYPIYSELLMPGDTIEVENQCIVRQQPTINPSFTNYEVKFWDFAVAVRNLDPDFYRFLSGFAEYTSEVAWDKPLPKWKPTDISKTKIGTLWDFLENPVNCIPEDQFCQLDYFRQAYGYIYDIYFRNETRQKSILNKLEEPGSWTGEDLLRINYDKDYFTTSLPKQSLGAQQAVPISGITKAVWNQEDLIFAQGNYAVSGVVSKVGQTGFLMHSDPGMDEKEGAVELLNQNTVDLKDSASVLLKDLTNMLAMEALSTINAIAGIRTDEFLDANWGESPSSEVLQYPIPFGRSVMNIITSEVLQTANNTNERDGVGDMYGHGMGVGESAGSRFHAKEFCIYMKLMYIKPNTTYGGQGIVKSKCQNSKYDFPFPILNHLSMQPIYASELLYAPNKKPTSNDNGVTITEGEEDPSASVYNNRIIGYKPVFEEYTSKRDKVSGLFIQEQYYDAKDSNKLKTKDNLYNWTEARFFSIEENKRPIINDDFLQVRMDNRNYQVVDNTIERTQFLCWHKNIVGCWRSMDKTRMPTMLGVTEGLR
nr:MAG TPA: Major capsid protein [Microviridae sp.]